MAEWYPWFPTLFRGDTMRLSVAERGAYRDLIDHYMETGRPLDDDDQVLALIVRIPLDEWLGYAPKIRPYFVAEDGLLRLKRCDREIKQKSSKSQARADAGAKGGRASQAKQKQRKDNKTNDLSSTQSSNVPSNTRQAKQLPTDRQTDRTPKPMTSVGGLSGQLGDRDLRPTARDDDHASASNGQSRSSNATDEERSPAKAPVPDVLDPRWPYGKEPPTAPLSAPEPALAPSTSQDPNAPVAGSTGPGNGNQKVIG